MSSARHYFFFIDRADLPAVPVVLTMAFGLEDFSGVRVDAELSSSMLQ